MIAAAAAALAAVTLLGIGLVSHQKAASRVKKARVLNERLAVERDALAELSARVSAIESRKRNARNLSVLKAVDEVVNPLGLKSKLKSAKSAPGGGTLQEERAELTFEDLTMNESVNLLYAMEGSRFPLLTRKANIRTDFEDPRLLNLNLTVSLIKPE
jgi:hypothetical protein